jgi:hypothetical protein
LIIKEIINMELRKISVEKIYDLIIDVFIRLGICRIPLKLLSKIGFLSQVKKNITKAWRSEKRVFRLTMAY